MERCSPNLADRSALAWVRAPTPRPIMAAPGVDPFPENEIPMPDGMPAPAAPPAPAPVIGPLPYNCKLNADGQGFDIYGYSQTAIAKEAGDHPQAPRPLRTDARA